jgi:RHH-type rel operon transcriptional repressor/antitoxin RelB
VSAVSLRLPEDSSNRLERLAELRVRSKSSYMIEAIREHIDDLEDLYLSEQRLIANSAGKSKTHTLAEMEQSLGYRFSI